MQIVSEMTCSTGEFFLSSSIATAPRSSAAPKTKETIVEQLRRELTAVMVALTPEGRDQVVAEMQAGRQRAQAWRQPVRPAPKRPQLVDTPAARAAAQALFNFDFGGATNGDD